MSGTTPINIPPDPEGMNDKRAQWADIALKAFRVVCGGDDEDALPDLLCNFRHWADRNGVDFEHMLRRSTGCYEEEITPGESDGDEESEDGDLIFIMPVSRILK